MNINRYNGPLMDN